MGFLTIIRKQKLKDRQIRVLVLGLDNSGKTTIVKSLLGEDVSEVSPTIGFTIKTHSLNSFTLDIWDIGGQKSLRPFWENYFEKTDCLAWVVDVTAYKRLNECKSELHDVLRETKHLSASLVIFVNKVDIVGQQRGEEIAQELSDMLDLSQLKQHHRKIILCSALTGEGIREGFDWILQDAEDRLFSVQAKTATTA